MLPDCVGVWYASCSSWVKSESLNRRYLSFWFLTILALIRRNKNQTAVINKRKYKRISGTEK